MRARLGSRLSFVLVVVVVLVAVAWPQGHGGVVTAANPQLPPAASTQTPTPTATGSPTPTPTATEIPTPPLDIAEIQLTPSTAVQGTSISVTGGGFAPGEPVRVFYTALLIEGGFTTVQITTTARANGTIFVSQLPVPINVIPETTQVHANGLTSGTEANAFLVIVPPATPTSTPTPTSTSTPTPSPTATPTSTPVPTRTPTSTPTPKPPPPPAPTATPRPAPPPYVLRFNQLYLWYGTVRVGTWDHIVVQANHRQKLGVDLHVIFATGKALHYSATTTKLGHWEKTFPVPRGTIGRFSHDALAVVQLRHDLKTVHVDLTFSVIR